MRIILFGLCLVVLSTNAGAGNIFVVDSGLYPVYRSQLHGAGRLLKESCYSANGDLRRLLTADFNNPTYSHYYQYKYASLCLNKSDEYHGNSASTLRKLDLPGALGKGGNPDVSVPVITSPHQNIIANVITNNTSSSVKQWHVHADVLLGLNTLGEIDWTNYNVLDQTTSVVSIINALEDLGSAFHGLNGVKIVNISSIAPEAPDQIERRYTTPCDNHPTVRKGILLKYSNEISRLRSRGVTVVVGTDNTQNNQALDNYELPFPACLSTTVAVAGLDNFGRAQGTIGPHLDFVAPFTARDPITNIIHTGTSYATPLVASYLVELQTINPTKSTNDVLNALRNTADLHYGERKYGSTTIRYTIPVPNFARAKNSIIDSFWKDFIQLVTGQKDAGLYGWNYGTSKHDNGILSFFKTVTTSQNKEALSIDVGQRNRDTSNQKNTSLNLESAVANATSSQVLKFSVRAYDIDTSDEVEVFINNVSYGNLKKTASNQLGNEQVFCMSVGDLTTNGSDNVLKLKTKTSGETWGVRDLKVEILSDTSFCQDTVPSFPELPDNDDRVQGSNEAYGDAYGRDDVTQVPVTFNLSQSKPTSSTYDGIAVQRDVRVKFITKHGDTSSALNKTLVYVNGTQRISTGYYSTGDERSYEYIIKRNYLKQGENTFLFRPLYTSTGKPWGIRNISIEYIEPVELTVGSQDNALYGYNQTPSRFAGLRANFSLSNTAYDYRLSVTGWDIDRADETEVFINGSSLGYLSAQYNAYNSGDIFTLSKSSLLVGTNQIEFVQRYPDGFWTGVTNEEWAVKDIKVRVSRPDLSVSDMKLHDTVLHTDQSFSVSANVINIGETVSKASTLYFLISNNESINLSDTVVATSSIPTLSINSSLTITKSILSSLVNKGYFIGVCASVVTNETTTNNNCSEGIVIDSKAIVAPMIMLLLGDD